MLLIGIVAIVARTVAEISPYYSTAQFSSPPVYYSRIYSSQSFPVISPSLSPTFLTTEKPYNMAEEVDGLVKYYTEMVFPSTAQREQRLKLPSRSPYRLERTPPLRTPVPLPPSQFSIDQTDFLPEKDLEYVGKLPFREADPIPIRARGLPQYVQQEQQEQQPAAAYPTPTVIDGYPTAAATLAGAAPSADASSTTGAPTTTTTNGYNAMGWKTDDDGNVFVGDDNAKLLLIQAAPKKYWDPLPKDWPEADLFGSMFPDSKLYRGPPAGACPKC